MAVRRAEADRLKEQRRKTVVQVSSLSLSSPLLRDAPSQEYREAAVVAIQRSWDAAHADLLTCQSTTDLSHTPPQPKLHSNL